MSSDYFTILQLTSPATTDQLEMAYRRSRDRYIQLTSAGPLRYYRNDLLAAVERAYWGLKQPVLVNLNQPLSHLGLKVAGSFPVSSKAPVKSAVKKATLLTGHAGKRKNTEYEQRLKQQTSIDKQKQAHLEDEFCRQVIYRLEGDLLRHDARGELFQLANRLHIQPFRPVPPAGCKEEHRSSQGLSLQSGRMGRPYRK